MKVARWSIHVQVVCFCCFRQFCVENILNTICTFLVELVIQNGDIFIGEYTCEYGGVPETTKPEAVHNPLQRNLGPGGQPECHGRREGPSK